MQTLEAQAIGASSDPFGLSFGRNASATLLIVSTILMFAAMLIPRPPVDFRASITLDIARPVLSGGLQALPDTDFEYTPPVESGDLIGRWQPFIAEASRRFSIPETWLAAVMATESGGRTMLDGRPITSHAGAAGLMQLMRGTYQDMRVAYGLGEDIHNPRDNILAGAAYLNLLRKRYGYPALFAAYNAGPARLEEHLRRGKSLPRETRNYLGSVTRLIRTTAVMSKPKMMELASATVPGR